MKRPWIFTVFLLVLLASCGTAVDKPHTEEPSEAAEQSDSASAPPAIAKKVVPDVLINASDTLVKVDTYNKNIRWELKYATSDNFMNVFCMIRLKQFMCRKVWL